MNRSKGFEGARRLLGPGREGLLVKDGKRDPELGRGGRALTGLKDVVKLCPCWPVMGGALDTGGTLSFRWDCKFSIILDNAELVTE